MRTRLTTTIALTLLCSAGWGAEEEGLAYPCFRNADGSGNGGALEGRLITKVKDRRLVWESEEKRLSSSYNFIIGGAGGPVVADGKVYVYYSFPSGELDQAYYDKNAKGRDLGKHAAMHIPILEAMGFASVEDYIKAKCAAASDDIVLCCDLKTGKTVWKKVYAGTSINRSKSGRGILKWNKTGPHIIPAVAYGKVCSRLDRGGIVCLDAATGEERWRIDTDPNAKDTGSLNNGIMLFGGGNFICLHGTTAVAYRHDTGKEAWRASGVGSGRGGCMVRTVIGKREVVVGANGVVIDATTGTQLYDCQALGGQFPAVDNGIAVFSGRTSDSSRDADKRQCGPQAYRLHEDRCEKLWELDRTYEVQDLAPVIMNGRYYAKVRSSVNTGASRFIGVDLATGEVQATTDFRSDGCGGSIGIGNQILIYDLLLLVTDPKNFHLDPDSGLSDNTMDWCSSHTAAAVGPYLITRGQHSLMCYDMRQR